jgi:hypothetical protein
MEKYQGRWNDEDERRIVEDLRRLRLPAPDPEPVEPKAKDQATALPRSDHDD